MLHGCGAQAALVRHAAELRDLNGLVIPGGESTTIGWLMAERGLLAEVSRRATEEGMGVFGTCAGMVLLAREVAGGTDLAGRPQPLLGLMDVTVQRNGFGRQRESFEADLPVPDLGEEPVRAVFIRAPFIERAGPGVRAMASLDGKVVLARQGRFLAAAFHPELTDDPRLHRYFLEKVLAG